MNWLLNAGAVSKRHKRMERQNRNADRSPLPFSRDLGSHRPWQAARWVARLFSLFPGSLPEGPGCVTVFRSRASLFKQASLAALLLQNATPWRRGGNATPRGTHDEITGLNNVHLGELHETGREDYRYLFVDEFDPECFYSRSRTEMTYALRHYFKDDERARFPPLRRRD